MKSPSPPITIIIVLAGVITIGLSAILTDHPGLVYIRVPGGEVIIDGRPPILPPE